MKPIISVIVPVYNVEKYLTRCIESLINQTLNFIEIILVDDGSSDKSAEICDEFACKDNRIKVIHKKNGGLGMARNSGLDVAKGEYVSFIDSDDYIDHTMYQTMYEEMKRTDSDTCYCYFMRRSFGGNLEKEKMYLEKKTYEKIDKINEILLEMLGAPASHSKDVVFNMSVCKGLFSRSIIEDNKIIFESERNLICEDLIFDLEYLQLSKRVSIVNKALYYYCENAGSLTHKYYQKRFEKEKELYRELVYRFNKLCSIEIDIERLNKFFLGRTRICIMDEILYNENVGLKDILKNIKTIVNDPILEKVFESYPYKKNLLKQRVFNFCLKSKIVFIIYVMAKIQCRYKLRKSFKRLPVLDGRQN